MRILALYNTRGMVGPLETLRTRHLEHCDLFVHCGNSMVDYQNEFIAGYVVIRGGDDFENRFLRDYILEIEGYNVLMMNNLEYRGKDGIERVSTFVDELFDKIDIVLCATQTAPSSQMIDNVLYISPGDASDAYYDTYAIIETEEEGIRVSFFNIETGALFKMDYYEKEGMN